MARAAAFPQKREKKKGVSLCTQLSLNPGKTCRAHRSTSSLKGSSVLTGSCVRTLITSAGAGCLGIGAPRRYHLEPDGTWDVKTGGEGGYELRL